MGQASDGVWQVPGYVLLERIALGGRGEVYLAREGGDGGELVAIKVLRPEDAARADRVQAFIDEVNVSRLLIHPNIVRVYHGDIHDGLPYLVMEYVDGLTLWDVNERARMIDMRLPHPVSAYMVAKTAEALDYAHNLTDAEGNPLRLVHRDVSAVNVMATFDGAIKLLDFGIAKSTIRHHSTAPGIIKGKLDYLSPEQCEGGVIDAVTDIYSLGVLLFELVTGTRPFFETDVATLFRKVSRGERPRAREIRPDVPPRLERIIDRAMATKRKKRYPSARAMLEDLQGFLASCDPPPTSSTIARLLAELAPDRVRHVAEVYGPPETTAVSGPTLPPDDDLEAPTIAERGMAAQMAAFDDPEEAVTIAQRKRPPIEQLDPGPVDPVAPAPDEGVTATVVERSPFEEPAPGRGRTIIFVLVVLLAFSLATMAGVVVTIALRGGFGESSPSPSAASQGQLPTGANDRAGGEANNALDAAVTPPEPGPISASQRSARPTSAGVGPAADRGESGARLQIRLFPATATVVVDGRPRRVRRGRVRLDLPSGEHTVEVTAPGHQPVTRTVRLAPGETKDVAIRLEALMGRLTVRSRNRAMVFIGGRRLRLTPVENIELEPGLYDVRVSNRHGGRRRRVRIQPGEVTEVFFDL